MKFSRAIFLATVMVSGAAFAEEGQQDFGDLLGGGNFSITQQKTSLKDNQDISNFQIKVTPTRDEFVYKVNSVRTPGVFSKKNFKVVVERQDGKVARITSEDYVSGADHSGTEGLQTVAIGTDGKVDSFTNCYQDYGFGFLNTKKNKSDYKCLTVNREVCTYLEKNAVDEAMVEKIKNCQDLLGNFVNHQGRLSELSKGANDSNLRALGLKGGFWGFLKSTPKNFYDIEANTLERVGAIVQGYGRAVAQCKSLKDKNYLRPEPQAEAPKADAKDGATQQ